MAESLDNVEEAYNGFEVEKTSEKIIAERFMEIVTGLISEEENVSSKKDIGTYVLQLFTNFQTQIKNKSLNDISRRSKMNSIFATLSGSFTKDSAVAIKAANFSKNLLDFDLNLDDVFYQAGSTSKDVNINEVLEKLELTQVEPKKPGIAKKLWGVLFTENKT